MASLATVLLSCLLAGGAWAKLPDSRSYELVSPVETNGGGLGSALLSTDGETVNFESEPFGDATIGGQNVFQAKRTTSGWNTRAITPKSVAKEGFFAQTAALFFSPDLTKAIFTTAQPLAAGDEDKEGLDLYEETEPSGTIDWVTQGPEAAPGENKSEIESIEYAAGKFPATATYAGATADGSHVVFDTFESLTKDAHGIDGDVHMDREYLYDRDVSSGQTHLVNVDDEDKLLDAEGAVLGNGVYLTTGEPPSFQYLPAAIDGTTTNAISQDGRKIFFESPNPTVGEYRLGTRAKSTHIYMRDNNERTVKLDSGSEEGEGESRYIGASQDGSKVFFISNEAIAGDEFKDTELYMYDTVEEKLTPVSVVPQGSTQVAAELYGVTAVSNDGSHVYYVAKGVLASNLNDRAQGAVEGEPNFYVYDTVTHTNTFITKLGLPEVEPSEGVIGRLVAYLDLERPAVPTPDGKVLVFMSKQNLTGEDENGTTQVYRYDASGEKMLCVSCDPGATGSSTLGIGSEGGSTISGGSYDPVGHSAPMDVTGDEIIFNTENGLVPEDQNTNVPPAIVHFGELALSAPRNIDPYEWHDGHVYLLSSGQAGFSGIQGITPSGRDLLIDTTLNLTKQDTDGYPGVYDLRVDGGFPETEGIVTPPCASDESCHGGTQPNPLFTAPGSATLLGSPELVPPAEVEAAPKATKPKPKPKPKKPAKKKKKAKKKHKKAKGKKARANHKRSHKEGTR